MDQEDAAERAELISRMFALVTAKLEDGATIAAASQARQPAQDLLSNADALRELLSETVTIVDAAATLLSAQKVTAHLG